MEKFSVSFTLGKASVKHGVNINHNNRKFTAYNVDEKRTADNIIFKQQDVQDAYHQLFKRIKGLTLTKWVFASITSI